MRLNPIPPKDLGDRQRRLYDTMRRDIDQSFRGFVSLREDGALLGPWNPWLQEPRLGAPIWHLNMVLAAEAILPRKVREVAIMAVGAEVRRSLRDLRPCRHRQGRRPRRSSGV